MQRLKDEFFQKIEAIVPLTGRSALDIGCGDGKRTVEIANRCTTVTGIEPIGEKVTQAKKRNIANATFIVGSAEKLPFDDQLFDVIFFTLSLHHVPMSLMETAINEAVRVVRPSGYIIFLEPAEKGTFFDAELRFDIADGDERHEKTAAYAAILASKKLRVAEEIDDETLFQYESVDDFIESMAPKKNQSEAKIFLEKHDYLLNATRRIIIARPVKVKKIGCQDS